MKNWKRFDWDNHELSLENGELEMLLEYPSRDVK